MSKVSILGIKLYRYVLSPYLGTRCRYTPTCSEYAEEALRHYGFVKGICLSLRRLARCMPMGRMGYDPLP